MPTLGTYRNINEHDILQDFKWGGAMGNTKGTLVKISVGVSGGQNLTMLGAVGATYANTVNQRYGIIPSVVACNGSGDAAIGILLYDTKEVDENNMPLLYDRNKQEQMQCSLSGQPTAVLTKGVVEFSGVEGARITAAGPAYLGLNGGLTSSGSAAGVSAGLVTKVGTFLGPQDDLGFVRLKLDL